MVKKKIQINRYAREKIFNNHKKFGVSKVVRNNYQRKITNYSRITLH